MMEVPWWGVKAAYGNYSIANYENFALVPRLLCLCWCSFASTLARAPSSGGAGIVIRTALGAPFLFLFSLNSEFAI